jgi:phosphomannomutase/phosphoglucomutase
MSFRRIFEFLLALSIAIYLALAGFFYFDARMQSEAANRQAARFTAEAMARHVGILARRLTREVTKAASAPSVAEAFSSGDAQRLADEEARLTRTLSDVWEVRLLPPGISQVDETRDPPLGYADLEMIKQAANADPLPALHQPGTPNARLVVARRVRTGEQAVGVLLVSYATKSLDELRLAPGDGVALELRQGRASLQFSGDAARKSDTPDGETPVAGTDWKVAYWSAAPDTVAWMYPVAVVFGAVLLGVIFLAAHRWTLRALAQDEDSLYRLVRDIMIGRAQGNYPVRLNDLQRLIARVTQFKHPPPESPAALTGTADFSQHLGMDEIDRSSPG